jgi:hypothetical protein
VSRLLTVTGLALRELWISFRLLVAVGSLVLAVLPFALLPPVELELFGQSWTPLELFAMGLAAALAVVAGLAAGALAGERRRGTVGWLVSRSVPRPLVVVGWFCAFAVVLLLGLVPAGALAWLSLGGLTESLSGPAALAVPLLAAWAAGAAAVALGLLLGSRLPAIPAALLTALLVAAALLPGASGLLPDLAAPPSPAASLAIIGGLLDAARPIADSLRAAGLSLVAAGAGLVLGAAALGRADL